MGSYGQHQAQVEAYPPPQTAYPPPGAALNCAPPPVTVHPPTYPSSPPPGYPGAAPYAQQVPLETKKRGDDGFWKGWDT
ncbi:hypothetical protein HPP92_026357 [Vanilla planifolia]|uniref:Uncharacterized protein n=1 Tax=Vanilla planifolia TaxID=51239 RepID=A0A835U9Y0_VANPL|nr:hypothetical protein HPP92_026357 [Vanilla planifolia]